MKRNFSYKLVLASNLEDEQNDFGEIFRFRATLGDLSEHDRRRTKSYAAQDTLKRQICGRQKGPKKYFMKSIFKTFHLSFLLNKNSISSRKVKQLSLRCVSMPGLQETPKRSQQLSVLFC